MASRFIVYRPAWRLTWLSRLLGLLLLAAIGWVWVHRIYPFLAPDQPVATDTLVVEGWMPDTALATIVREVNSGRYRRVFLTGGVILQNDPNSQYRSYPGLMKAALVHRGLRPDLLVAVASPLVIRDRTYASAVGLRDWLVSQHIVCRDFNLLTAGPHSRRSRLLFGKAFADQCAIGVIPVPRSEYDPRVWWRTSAGFREVIDETIAYIYARCFFYPG